MQDLKHNVRAPESDQLRIVMIERGVRREALAARIGITPNSLSDFMWKGCKAECTRRRIEAAFDYDLEIWSNAKALKLRKGCVHHHGFDPELLSHAELLKKCKEMGMEGRNCNTTRAQMIADILAKLSVRFNPQTVKL